MNVTVRQLKAFVLLAKTGSFTQAARQLFVTQSALSLLIRELESGLQTRLVNRTTRQISLTPVGQAFLPAAQRVLADLEQAVLGVDQLLALRRGRVVVVAPLVLSGTFLSPVVADFLRQYPDIELILKDCLPDDVLPLVLAGTADLGIGTFHRTHGELTRELLFRESLVAVYRQDLTALRGATALAWAQLQGHDILVLPRGSIFRELAEAGFAAAGLVLRPRLEATYVGTLLGLVQAGLGVAVVPGYATALGDPQRLAWRRLEQPVIEREVVMVHRAGLELAPAAAEFAQRLRDAAATLQPPAQGKPASQRS